MENFNLKKFLVENKLTTASKLLKEQTNINWNYPDVESEDYYYEPTENGYFISLPISGTDEEGNTVRGLYNTEVSDLSQEVLDDLDIDPSKIQYPVEEDEY